MKIAKRKYKSADSRLIQSADDLMDSAERDAAELAPYEVNATYLSEVEDLRDDFSETPTDNALMGDMMTATENRNEKMIAVRAAINPIATRFRTKFGEDSGRYRGLGIELLSQQDGDELVRTGRSVVQRATQYLSEVGQGLTQTEIDALGVLTGELDVLVDVQRKAVKDRDIAVDDRIKKGNALYEKLVELAEYGKSAWLNKNEAKYNDYVITEVQKKAAQVLEGNISSGQIINLSATDVQAVTQLTGEATGNGLQIYFSTNPTDYPNGFQQAVNEGVENSFIAGAIGFDPGNRERLMLYNPGPNNATYKVVVEA